MAFLIACLYYCGSAAASDPDVKPDSDSLHADSDWLYLPGVVVQNDDGRKPDVNKRYALGHLGDTRNKFLVPEADG